MVFKITLKLPDVLKTNRLWVLLSSSSKSFSLKIPLPLSCQVPPVLSYENSLQEILRTFVSSSSPVITSTSSYFLLFALDSSYSLADSLKDLVSFDVLLVSGLISELITLLNSNSVVPFEFKLVDGSGSSGLPSADTTRSCKFCPNTNVVLAVTVTFSAGGFVVVAVLGSVCTSGTNLTVSPLTFLSQVSLLSDLLPNGFSLLGFNTNVLPVLRLSWGGFRMVFACRPGWDDAFVDGLQILNVSFSTTHSFFVLSSSSGRLWEC